MSDQVNHPSHYTQGGIEVIDVLEAKLSQEELAGFLRGNLIKYAWRAGYKEDALVDLKKGKWYLDRLIETKQRMVKAKKT